MNITKVAEEYINSHPSISDCVKRRLINYSSLSRQILRECRLDSKHFDAVLIACRRHYYKVRKQKTREEDVLSIVRKSKVEVKNKIIVAVVEKAGAFSELLEMEKKARKAAEPFYIMEGSQAVTVVTTEDFIETIQSHLKGRIVKLNKGLALVTIKSPREIETVSGVLAFMTSRFSDQGINILENMSCWTGTLFVISEKDVGKAVGALSAS